MNRYATHSAFSQPTQLTPLSRRQFLGGTLVAAASASVAGALPARSAETVPAEFKRKLKLGVIGNGGRGSWIAKLFQQHGGYEMFAVADYFPEVANACGEALGVDPARRFSTLSGYQRLIACGVEAVAIEAPPYFMPEHATAAVVAGLHVYMAKPVAVDVPGSLKILAAARQATAASRCFRVDYQMPTDPVNNEVLKRIRGAGFGPLQELQTTGICGGFADPPLTAILESRLRGLVWVNDVALGCDYIGNYDIHAIDAAIWAAGQRPVAAMGGSRIGRANPHGDGRDVCSVVFEYADGLVHSHFGLGLANQATGELSCRVFGRSGHALINYWGKAEFRGSDDAYSGSVDNLYEAGAVRNIAAFYRNVTEGQFENATASRAVDGVLTCILGREAAARHTRLTMEKVIEENKRLAVDLSGLKS